MLWSQKKQSIKINEKLNENTEVLTLPLHSKHQKQRKPKLEGNSKGFTISGEEDFLNCSSKCSNHWTAQYSSVKEAPSSICSTRHHKAGDILSRSVKRLTFNL